MKFKYLEVKLYKIYLDDTEAFIKAMDEDYFKEDVFEFCHPLGKKKPFIRHYVFLPANGNTFMMVGQCTHPLDSACVAVVINSENYKSSYVAIYDYERVVDNSDLLMESLVRGFNKKLKGYGAKMTYEFWDVKPEDARWSDDFLLTFTHNYHLTKGKNVAKMGYEDVHEHQRKIKARNEKRKKDSAHKKKERFEDFIEDEEKVEPIMRFLRETLNICWTPKTVGLTFRLLKDLKFHGENNYVPYHIVMKEFEDVELKERISKTTYNRWVNYEPDSCQVDRFYKKIKNDLKGYLGGIL